MKLILLAALAFGAVACASSVTVRVEWSETGREPSVRFVEFEDYGETRSGETVHVWLEHREWFWPWTLVRHYLGEQLSFSFPAPEEKAVAVDEALYLVQAYAPVEATLRSGEVRPTPEDERSSGEFRLVFDAVASGNRAVVITLSGRLPR